MSLHMNATLPCGTESALRNHDAHGVICRTCHGLAWCLVCRQYAEVVRDRFADHDGWVGPVGRVRCSRSGRFVVAAGGAA